MNLPRMHETAVASSEPSRGQLHSDAMRRLSSMKEVDSAHLTAVRQDALRLVTEGIVEVDMESPASYDRQGDLAYYSEESLQQRLALRENPLLLRLTRVFWSLTNAGVEATMIFEDYCDIMVRVHKILNEHFDVQKALHSIEDDWASDTKGTNILTYDAFHLSLYELVDLWCDSVKVDDYVSLLYLILTGITNVEDHHLFFREVEDVHYVEVTEYDLRPSMADIEHALDDLSQIGPKRPVKPSSPKHQVAPAIPVAPAPPVAPLARAESPPPRQPSPRKLATPATIGEEIRAEKPQRASSPDRKTTATPGMRLTTPAATVFNAKTVAETMLFPMEGTAPVVTYMPSSPPKGTTDARVHVRQVDTIPATAKKNYQEQTTDVVRCDNGVDSAMTTDDKSEKLVDAAPPVRRRSTVVATVESVPLVRRDFGGFSIMSARDDVGQSKAQVTVTVSRQIPKDDDDGDATDATNDMLWQSERDPKRDEAITKAFSVQNRASLTRPLTPPSFSGPFASPPKRVETERVRGRQGARKMLEVHVEKVHALAKETLGVVEKSNDNRNAEPAQIHSALVHGTTGLREVESVVEDDALCVQVPSNATDTRSERRRSSSVSVEDKIKLTALLASVRLQWHNNTEPVGSTVESLQGQTIGRLPPMTNSPPKPSLTATPQTAASFSLKALPAIESPPKESQRLEPQHVTPRAKPVQRLMPDPLVRKFRVRKEVPMDPLCSPGRQAKTLEAISTVSSATTPNPPKVAQAPEKNHLKGSHEPVHLTPLALSAKGTGATPLENQPPSPAKVDKKLHKSARVQHEGSMKFIALVKPQAPSANDFVHIMAVVPTLNQ